MEEDTARLIDREMVVGLLNAAYAAEGSKETVSDIEESRIDALVEGVTLMRHWIVATVNECKEVTLVDPQEVAQ